MTSAAVEVPTHLKIRKIQQDIRLYIINHQILYERSLTHPQDQRVKQLMAVYQQLLMSLGRAQEELIFQFKTQIRAEYGDEKMDEMMARYLSWPDRHLLPPGLRSNAKEEKKPKVSINAELVKKTPTLLPGTKMKSVLKRKGERATLQHQATAQAPRKESERLKAAAATRSAEAAEAAANNVKQLQSLLKARQSGIKSANIKVPFSKTESSYDERSSTSGDTKTSPEPSQPGISMAGCGKLLDDALRDGTDLTQDMFLLSNFGLLHKNKLQDVVVHQGRRKRRTLAGQSSYYNDYHRPKKRSWKKKVAAADVNSSESSEESDESGEETDEQQSQEGPSPIKSDRVPKIVLKPITNLNVEQFSMSKPEDRSSDGGSEESKDSEAIDSAKIMPDITSKDDTMQEPSSLRNSPDSSGTVSSINSISKKNIAEQTLGSYSPRKNSTNNMENRLSKDSKCAAQTPSAKKDVTPIQLRELTDDKINGEDDKEKDCAPQVEQVTAKMGGALREENSTAPDLAIQMKNGGTDIENEMIADAYDSNKAVDASKTIDEPVVGNTKDSPKNPAARSARIKFTPLASISPIDSEDEDISNNPSYDSMSSDNEEEIVKFENEAQLTTEALDVGEDSLEKMIVEVSDNDSYDRNSDSENSNDKIQRKPADVITSDLDDDLLQQFIGKDSSSSDAFNVLNESSNSNKIENIKPMDGFEKNSSVCAGESGGEKEQNGNQQSINTTEAVNSSNPETEITSDSGSSNFSKNKSDDSPRCIDCVDEDTIVCSTCGEIYLKKLQTLDCPVCTTSFTTGNSLPSGSQSSLQDRAWKGWCPKCVALRQDVMSEFEKCHLNLITTEENFQPDRN